METKLTIEVTVNGDSLFRNYILEDGMVPESAREGLQEMVDRILEAQEE